MTDTTASKSDPLDKNTILRTPPEIQADPRFAENFPLDVEVETLGIKLKHCESLYSDLGIRDVKDFYIKKITFADLCDHFEDKSVAVEIQDALIKKDLPALQGKKATNLLYAFFDTEKRQRLSLRQINVLSNCKQGWGGIPNAVVAREISVTEEKLEEIIKEAFELLQE